MLKDHDSSAIVAVSDLGRARHFYEGVLGLELVEGSKEGVLLFKTGATPMRSSGESATRSIRSSLRWRRSRPPSNIIPTLAGWRATSTSPGG
jgi:catechol 2,3-dioxygenase-like lactoylglutathione lyase family enzyme